MASPRPFTRRATLVALGITAITAGEARAQTPVVLTADDVLNLPGYISVERLNASVAIASINDVNESTIAVSDLSGGPFWPGGPRPVNPTQFTWPGGATSAGILGPSAARYQAGFGSGFEGVARLLVSTPGGTSGCTGTLIDARHILTAAHCVSAPTLTSVTVGFLNGAGGLQNYTVTPGNIAVMAGYTGAVVDERDLAILTLPTDAAAWIPRYRIWYDNPLFQDVYEVGFGSTGNGVTGAIMSNQFDPVPVRRAGLNRFELTRDAGFVFAGHTPVTNILVADFDGADPGGTYAVARGGVTGWASRTLAQNNRNCNFWDPATFADPVLLSMICQQGYGLDEVLTGSGDSGGPAFIRGGGNALFIAGVASFGNVACFPDQRLGPNGVTPQPRSDAGCAPGFVRYGSRFGMITGHVWTGGTSQAAFIRSVAPTAFVPEPSTYMLMATGLGMVGLIGLRSRRGAR